MVISRALVEIFRHPALADSLALRGGTALSKLQLRPPARYSEDIDLVQTAAPPSPPIINPLPAAPQPPPPPPARLPENHHPRPARGPTCRPDDERAASRAGALARQAEVE